MTKRTVTYSESEGKTIVENENENENNLSTNNLLGGAQSSWLVEFRELQLDNNDGLLGSGAFGIVYKGKWREKNVAIKILRNVPEKEMLQEVEILCKLSHPNIVECYCACFTPKCIVMEYLPFTLKQQIQKNGSVQSFDNLNFYSRIAIGIAKGISYLHACNPPIIHRDLKPANILLDNNMEPRIADFGISREEPEDSLSMTKVGTIHFMAPEILLGKHYNTAVDIYSFGIILYSMITGETPWKGEREDQIKKKVEQNERPNLPASHTKINKIISQCWEHDFQARPDANSLEKELISTFDDPSSSHSLSTSTTTTATASSSSSCPAISTVEGQTPQKDSITLPTKICLGHHFHPTKECDKTNGHIIYAWVVYIKLLDNNDNHNGTDYYWKKSNKHLESVIDYVEFHLHEDFNPHNVKVKQMPFQVKRKGWGTFTVTVIVYWKESFVHAPTKLEHTLSFLSDSCKLYNI